MKVCLYCGQQNADDQNQCHGCGQNLKSVAPGAPPSPKSSSSNYSTPPAATARTRLLSAGFFEDAEPVDISSIDMGWSQVEGFFHPDWKTIGRSVRDSFPAGKWPQVWREIGIAWLAGLRQDLGGEYRQYESFNFLLLSAESPEKSRFMLGNAETALHEIESVLGALTRSRPLYGKRVILAFNEPDDYYSYISRFHCDGEHAFSAGVFIRQGYGHIALQSALLNGVTQVLIHELTHNCVMGLRLPIWLNEGLTQRVEHELGRIILTAGTVAPRPIVDVELARKHRSHWDETNIQEFWAGTSFYRPDEGNRLSYNLAQIMVELLSGSWADFLNFAGNAHVADAGQDAALKCVGVCLGETLSRFLGPGNWRPNRKAIRELLEKRHKAASGPETSNS
jgi:hypothetical protein